MSPRGAAPFHIPSIAFPPWGLTSEMRFPCSGPGSQAIPLLELASTPSSLGTPSSSDSPLSALPTSAGSSFGLFCEKLKSYFVCIQYPGLSANSSCSPVSKLLRSFSGLFPPALHLSH